jgi:hypothetical protein
VNHTYVPPQHGAWAFLGLPLVLGLTLATPTWAALLLGVAWVSAYPWSYAAFGLARAKRKARFRRPLLVWSVVLVPALVLLLVVRPWLLWWSPLFVVGFLVNLLYASRNDERAILNDLVFVLECAAVVVVTWAVDTTTSGSTPPSLASVPSHVWLLALLCALVLTGSTLHVKSLIRERRDVRYARASRWYAVLCLLLTPLFARAWGLPQGWWFVLPFLFFAVRSFVVASVVARRPVRPAPLGMLELVGFLLVALSALLAR